MNRVIPLVLLLTTACAGAGDDAPEPADAADEVVADLSLDDVRSATDRFRDVEVALAEGYIPDPMNMCETADMMGLPAEAGSMGIHYFRPDLLGITGTEPRVNGTGTHTDFTMPSVLLYEPQADGSMELVGVENLTFVAAWEAAGNAGPPTFRGEQYNLMADDPATPLDEGHGFEPHYDLHVWLYRDNPNGVFTSFNPAVSCEYHQGGVRQGA